MSFDLDPFPRHEINTNFEGGKKSQAHIMGQFRLQKIFNERGAIALLEEPVPLIDDYGDVRDYQVDVMVTNSETMKNIMALEVDTLKYGIQKKKSPKHMNNRDSLITARYQIPVIRFDVLALKMTGKYHMNDEEIFNFAYKKLVDFHKKRALIVKAKIVK